MNPPKDGERQSAGKLEQLPVDQAITPGGEGSDSNPSEFDAVNLCLSEVASRIRKNLRWFDNANPDVAEARETALHLVERIAQLEMLIGKLNGNSESGD